MGQALANLQTALEDSGATIRDVLKTTVYVASSDRGDLVAAWDEVAGFFGDHDVPSSLTGASSSARRDACSSTPRDTVPSSARPPTFRAGETDDTRRPNRPRSTFIARGPTPAR